MIHEVLQSLHQLEQEFKRESDKGDLVKAFELSIVLEQHYKTIMNYTDERDN